MLEKNLPEKKPKFPMPLTEKKKLTPSKAKQAVPQKPINKKSPEIDPVDQASIDSFPASDPPGWWR